MKIIFSLSSMSCILAIVLVFNLSFVSESKVSYENVKLFFQLTYDQNQDQIITWKQFCDYFKLIEPDQEFAFHILNSAFNSFDTNKDSNIAFKQFLQIADVDFIPKLGHKQIHLGFTQNQNQMQVMWVSTPDIYDEPVVIYGAFPTQLNLRQKATFSTYNVGHLGFHGRIYRAVMKNLKSNTKYYYKVGDLKSNTWSDLKQFKAPPTKNQTLDEVRIAIFGDMGTYVPFGHMVTKMLASQNTAKPYDFVFLTGDIAYAGVNGDKAGQLEPVWDLFGEQTQSFAAYTAFMPGVGNHQSYYNFTSYFNRYRLPRIKQNQTNLFFSFDYGQVHMVHLSSEHDYSKGSEQYQFLEEDLKKARQNPNTKWIILGTHRAFYCSDSDQYSPITDLTAKLQDLVNQYKVDIVQNGHLHAYQRTWPVYRGKALKQNQNQTYYVNPKSPIYVVQGTAGALIRQKWVQPAPQWSLKRNQKYGYGQITIKANYLKYEFISLPVGKIVDSWYIIKDEIEQKIQ